MKAFWLFVTLSAGLWGQAVSTSQIKGTIQDSTGATVAGAQVKVTQTDTGIARSAASGSDGGYVLPELAVGPYRMEVTKDGFATYIQSGIVLQVASNPTIDVALRVGAVSEQVRVEANAAMVETQSSGVGEVVDSQRVTNLPLIGRNVTDLVALAGGATNGSDTQSNTTRNYATATFSVAGGLTSGTSFVLDGALHNDMTTGLNLPLPFPDALLEFKVETSSLPAQYGMHPAAAINAVTKSGTNDWHGDAFEFVRNYQFDARNFFAAQRDSLKRNQFGGTLGGPIKRNKLFFFAAFQDTINRQNDVPTKTVVPTADMIAGNFTAFASAACNHGTPLTLRGPFVNNQLTPSQLSAPAVAIAKTLPTPSDACGDVVFGTPNVSDDRQAVAKIDYQLNEKQTLFLRYLAVNFVAPVPYDLSGKDPLTSAATGQDILIQSAALGHTFLLSPSAVNSFRATFSRTAVQRPTASFFNGQDSGINMYSYTETLGVAVTGAFTTSGTGPGIFDTNSYQLGDDLALIRGSHQMAFGISLAQWQYNLDANVLSAGNFTFSNQFTGTPLGDFITGNVTSLVESPPNTLFMYERYLGLYAQDSWKITPRLTLSYGLRWEPFFPQQIKDGHLQHFDFNGFLNGTRTSQYAGAPPGLVYPGDPGFPGKAGWNKDWKQFGPRAGLVWDPTGTGRMSIRASYSLAYDTLPAFLQNSVPISSPWVPRVSVTGVNFTNPWATQPGGNPFPLAPGATVYAPFGTFSSFDYNTRPDYVQSWNLSVQRQFGSNWLLSASYLGTEMVHLLTDEEGNPAVLVPNTAGTPLGTCPTGVTVGCNASSNTNQRRILSVINPANGKFFGSVATAYSDGTGSYNGMLLSVQRRLSRNVAMTANYTLSHCISDFVTASSTSFTGNAITDPGDRRFDRGNCNTSGTDRRQIFNATVIAETPRFNGRITRMLASGWRVSGIVIAQTGAFLNVTTGGVDTALNGVTNQRVNLIQANNVYGNGSPSNYLNASAFALPAFGTLGNLGAGAVAGPGFWDINMSLARTFRIKERQSIEVRGEAANVINHFNPGNPVVTFGASNFGQVISTAAGAGVGFVSPGDPRIMQFGFKYIF